MKATNTSQSNVAAPLNLNNGLSMGYIQSTSEENFQVSTKLGTVTAIKADSCLLAPAKNDQVLIAEVDFELAVIIAIVKQADRNQQTYQLNPGVHLTTHQGKVAIFSEQFDCIAAQQVNLYGQQLNLTANRANVNTQNYTLTSDFYSEEVGHLESVAAVVDQNVESYHFMAKNAFETISELQHRVIGNLHMLVDKNYRLDSETVDIYSEGDMKLQAEQIHMA